MDIQTLIVMLIVVASTVYAAWTLMPAAWRASSARGLLKLRWPGGFSAYLAKTAAGSSGCGCSGCDANPATPKKPKSSGADTRKVIPIRQSTEH